LFMPAFFAYFLSPLKFRPVFKQFVRREILGRYRGSMLGIAWAFISPLLMLGVYTFVFVEVFKARWPGAEESGGLAFSQRIFVGLMVFNLFSEMVARAPNLIVEQANLVKKVSFPLELLPFVVLGSALFHFCLSAVILLASVLVFNDHWPVTLLLAPVVVFPLLPLLMGLAWLLAAIGVFVRDVGQMVALLVSLLMFMSPVFYSAKSLSPRWQFWMNLNPLTPAIENLRLVVFSGTAPNWTNWLASLGVAGGVAVLGAWFFSKTRDGFADVL
jgi:lipopolysaccharide transport system permease protein